MKAKILLADDDEEVLAALSAALASELHGLGVRTLMVTGDAPATAAIVALAVGLDGALCPPGPIPGGVHPEGSRSSLACCRRTNTNSSRSSRRAVTPSVCGATAPTTRRLYARRRSGSRSRRRPTSPSRQPEPFPVALSSVNNQGVVASCDHSVVRIFRKTSCNQILARFLLVKSPTKRLNVLKFRFVSSPHLGLTGLDQSDWRFVESGSVPPGPWALYGDNKSFVQLRRAK